MQEKKRKKVPRVRREYEPVRSWRRGDTDAACFYVHPRLPTSPEQSNVESLAMLRTKYSALRYGHAVPDA